ncbi:MAG: hypothetical protein IPO72_11585 [Saprospiraceae bacterium]|nr:hypothetical protein [Candidatus Vicinibacter affinis]MBK7305455.1 hypothetical protein [Candidatus Vicinibacter affinis]MBK7800901.1 hypothetical protein [Candidatus Vicinibacter affinis]MBK9641899.1 hypothetical protein [Candidatus Vicinibacter affinis]MBP6584885.1 hypothetical protein [Flavobacterium sp.]
MTIKVKIFFVALGLGKITFEGHEVWVISEPSPLAMTMLTKKIKDAFEFKGGKHRINNIE